MFDSLCQLFESATKLFFTATAATAATNSRNFEMKTPTMTVNSTNSTNNTNSTNSSNTISNPLTPLNDELSRLTVDNSLEIFSLVIENHQKIVHFPKLFHHFIVNFSPTDFNMSKLFDLCKDKGVFHLCLFGSFLSKSERHIRQTIAYYYRNKIHVNSPPLCFQLLFQYFVVSAKIVSFNIPNNGHVVQNSLNSDLISNYMCLIFGDWLSVFYSSNKFESDQDFKAAAVPFAHLLWSCSLSPKANQMRYFLNASSTVFKQFENIQQRQTCLAKLIIFALVMPLVDDPSIEPVIDFTLPSDRRHYPLFVQLLLCKPLPFEHLSILFEKCERVFFKPDFAPFRSYILNCFSETPLLNVYHRSELYSLLYDPNNPAEKLKNEILRGKVPTFYDQVNSLNLRNHAQPSQPSQLAQTNNRINTRKQYDQYYALSHPRQHHQNRSGFLDELD